MIKEGLLEANKNGKIEIRGAGPLDKFYLVTGNNYLLLKKIEDPLPLERFEKLSAEIQEQFKRTGIKKSDIARAINWARKK